MESSGGTYPGISFSGGIKMIVPKPEPLNRVRIEAEISHLDKKIKAMHDKREREEVDPIDALEDLSNWCGWRDALSWVLNGCPSNPHEGDGYE